MNRTLRMWIIWVIAAAAPFFIFPSEAAVWDGPRSHPAAQKVEDAYVYIKYVDIHGRDIYATQTIKGVSGDYVNGNGLYPQYHNVSFCADGTGTSPI